MMEPVAGSPPSERPLEGLLVVDLSRYLPGPLVTRLLADLGARVLKIEEPGLGDPSRQAPPAPDGQSSLATLLLAGHESVALDLGKAAARDVLDGLLESADVLVESFRPGKLATFGLAPSELRQRFPGLVICSVTGWGQQGPNAGRAGHDLGYQAVAGSLAAGSGMPAAQTADVVGAWSSANAILAALWRRQQTGAGSWIDSALLDAAGHANLTGLAAEAGAAKQVGDRLMLTGALPCYDLYRARDGRPVAIAALEARFWKTLCNAVGRRDLVRHRLNQDPEIKHKIADLIAGKSGEEWAQLFAEHDIPAELVLSPAEARQHPQVEARGMVEAGADGFDRLAYPALIDGTRPPAGGALPELGQHTRAVLEEFGLGFEGSAFKRRSQGVGRRSSFKRWVAKVILKRRPGGR
nr:acetyl-CoA:oxalate CoA-transferase-like [Nerophis lumbriciformis]